MTAGPAERAATRRAPARRTQPAKTTAAGRAPGRRTQATQAPAATPRPARPAARATARPAPARTAKAAATARPAPARTAKAAAAARTSPARPAQRAVAAAIAKEAGHVVLPYGIGPVRVPPPDRLAFYGGIAALALFGIVEWPVALVIGVGHLLADDHHHKLLADFGEALGEA
jgi:hypothetical protein